VPAGHAPGAVGFLVRFADGDDRHTVAATGDFTLDHVAGRRGFPTDIPVDVEALFLTGATDEATPERLGRALGTALERARGGARTLVTTSGLTGVHAASLLSRLADRIDLGVDVVLVGQVAKVYDALDRRVPGVESVPVFDRTDAVLGPNRVVVAGPEVPRDGSSGRLFGAIADDPGACLVQLVGSGRDPVRSAGCTVHDYAVSLHASEADLERVVEALDPGEVVVTHAHGGARGRYNHLTDGVVWGTGDTAPHVVYEGGAWQTPPWMATDRLRGEFAAPESRTDGGAVLDLGPDPRATLADEPLDLDAFDAVVGHRPDDGDEADEPRDRRLYETTTAAVTSSVPADPTDLLHDPPPADVVSAVARARLGEPTPVDEAEVTTARDEQTVESEASGDDEPGSSPSVEDEGAAPADDGTTPDDETARGGEATPTLADLDPGVDPLVVGLLGHAAAHRPDRADDPAAVLAGAVESYLERRLAGRDHRTEPVDPTLSLGGDPAVVGALEGALESGGGLDVDRAVRAGVRAALGHDASTPDPAALPVPDRELVEAVATADDTDFDCVAGVLAAAVVAALD
jgi:putative mRNA 3-end processing factor